MLVATLILRIGARDATPGPSNKIKAIPRARRSESEDLMAFLFQVSVPGANQPNSIKAQIQGETIEPYRFLTGA